MFIRQQRPLNPLKLTRELNFSYLINELRRLCPKAVYDERLRNRAGLVRLLGPALDPETNLDLAVEILVRSLRHGRPGSLAKGPPSASAV